MKLRIINIGMEYDNDYNLVEVKVAYNGQDDRKTIKVNGVLPLSTEEYKGNESVPALVNVVTNHVMTELKEGLPENAE